MRCLEFACLRSFSIKCILLRVNEKYFLNKASKGHQNIRLTDFIDSVIIDINTLFKTCVDVVIWEKLGVRGAFNDPPRTRLPERV